VAPNSAVETPERVTRPDRRWAVLIAVFALGLALRLPTFFRPLLSDDEAIYATTADALSRGDLLYRDVVDHKPPLIYHVYQAGFSALGAYNVHGAHVFVVLAVLVTASLLMAARRTNGDRGGLAAATLYLIFSTTWHDYDALAANCELFVVAAQACAAWLLVRDRTRPAAGGKPALHFAVGCLIGVAALFKYQGLTFLGVSVGMLVWSYLVGKLSPMRLVGFAICQIIGATVPAALYLGACALAGNAEATIYWFRFNFSYVAAGLSGTEALVRATYRTALIGGVAIVAYALGLASAVGVVKGVVGKIRRGLRRDSDLDVSPVSLLGLLWLVTSAIAVAAGGRFFGHYFHLVLAPLCLLAGPMLVDLWKRGRAFRVVLSFLSLGPALTFFALASVARPVAAAIDESDPAYDEVAARIAGLTSPDQRVFIWGNSPQLYVLARRPMGTRFSFCNYMTGESPGTPTESGLRNADGNQLPVSWDMLFADLDSRRPELFVDAAAAGWDGYDKFPIKRYPRLQAYLDAHYRPIETANGVVLYRRVP
jgi:hypothetical protein